MIFQVVCYDKRNYINHHRSFALHEEGIMMTYIRQELIRGENFEVEIKKFDGELPENKESK